MPNIVINTRLLAAETTGLQRYLKELITRFPPRFKTISPLHSGGVLTSHFWEQVVLPLKIKKVITSSAQETLVQFLYPVK